MEIEIDYTRQAQDNAEEYFERAKKAKKKYEGALESAAELERKLESMKKEEESRESTLKQKRAKAAEGEWYEKFYWFNTSGGYLAIGGRNAVQNEEINSKYFEKGDLFFHADIYGGSVVILKNGEAADLESKKQAAQYAACFSRGWQSGLSTLDVYSLKREQVSKSQDRGSLQTGGFAMSGEREWYKSMPLVLTVYFDKKLIVVPGEYQAKGGTETVILTPGNGKKTEAAKYISKKLGFEDIDYIMAHIPTGPFYFK
ncbi:MAG: NFACT RNA binding domain-containing protein [Candidatus Micrarchaeia archaeon]